MLEPTTMLYSESKNYISDVDDVFVRTDLNYKYNVEKSMAEEFLDIYSFNPILEAPLLKKDEL